MIKVKAEGNAKFFKVGVGMPEKRGRIGGIMTQDGGIYETV